MTVQIIIFPLIFLSIVFVPVNNLPARVAVISQTNPLTHGVDATRQLFLRGTVGLGADIIGVMLFGHAMTILEDVLVVAIFSMVLLPVGVWSSRGPE